MTRKSAIRDDRFAKRWKAWLASEEGNACLADSASGQFLQNRLWRAFKAGWDAGRLRHWPPRK